MSKKPPPPPPKKSEDDYMRLLNTRDKRARRNYFKGDARYKTVAAMGGTTVAGGAVIPKRLDDVYIAKVKKTVTGLMEEGLLYDYGNEKPGTAVTKGVKPRKQEEEKPRKPKEDKMAELVKAQKHYWELEKKFGDKLIIALSHARDWKTGKKVDLNTLPAHTEKPSLDDPRYEAQWW